LLDQALVTRLKSIAIS